MDSSLRDATRVPGLLSILRLPLAIIFALTIHRSWHWPLAVLVVAGASDVLDGWYARHFHQETRMGALLDPVMDKVFVGTVIVVLLAAARLSLWEAVLLATRELGVIAIGLILVIRNRPRLLGGHPPRGLGKLTTGLQYAAAVLAAIGWSRDVAVFALAASVAGALATATYWRHERAPPRRR